MRKILIGTSLALAGSGAMAQTSITLYGVTDLYLGFASGTTTQQRINEGGHVASQIGFKGSEDLGGGLSAVFQLEAGVSTDTGAGNILATGVTAAGSFGFTRQAYAGLSGSWGQLLMGRQYTPIFRNTWRVDPFGNNSVFSPAILWAQTDSLGTSFSPWAARAENAIAYFSPTTNAIQGSLMYGPGEVPGNSSGHYYGGSISYVAPTFLVGYGYQQKNQGSPVAIVANPVVTKAHALSFSYEPGPWRVGGTWGYQQSDAAGTPKATLMMLYGSVNVGNGQLMAGVGRRDVANSANDQTSFTLGYNYDLSKRTVLYARYQRISNSGAGLVSLGTIPITTPGDSGSLIGFGVMHKF